ncbi:siderophore-interacting protein [Flaviflexus huanghaiensis]|uniref:siderophore-interacting protein n=1 Tax=Flaviflexus huanghaiensis TaxID=1111473 RepID=UPI0030CA5885
MVIPSQGPASGGIEFDPAGAREVILLGDETAAPAIARILEDLEDEGTSLSGQAFIEVPTSEDRLTIDGPSTIDVRWLPRDGAPRGALLGPALGWHMTTHEPATSDELIWETPTHSASGAPTPGPSATSEAWPYCWIAGESSVVTGLRRHLVRDVGIDRRRVAFMGYWREGVAMRG